MRIILSLSLAFIVLISGGCSSSSQLSDNTEQQPQVYDANSWKTLISDSCLSYFDGCNQCRRSAAGEVAACTRKACFKYRKPECLDDVK